MSTEAQTLKREFTFEKDGEPVTLSDPNPELSAEEVIRYYSSTYPELTTATMEEPKVQGSKVVHKAKTTVGTKG